MKKPGEQVDRYVIDAQLGRGGMGEVYEATDTRLGRRVALKLIVPGADADANQRMVREARAAASFEHPHAVVVYDVGEAEGATYLAMELVRGTSLRALVGDASAPVGRRLRWLVDVARALGAAHRQGIVHRDVKPDNVMIREDGVAKVLDFGIARRQARAVDPSAPTEAPSTPMSTITAAGVIVGTPQYAAPEQLRGEPLDGRADEFAWGVMAYELLSGGSPWRGADSVALLSQILSADPPPLAEHAPGLPAPVAAAVTRALAKRAEDRFPTIDEAADALEPFADAVASGSGKRDVAPLLVTPRRATTVGRVVRGTGRVIFWIFALIGGLLVVGIGSALLLAWKRGELEVSGTRIGPRVITVPALVCGDADVKGSDVTAELRKAVGHAACARVATQVGVEWGRDTGTKLQVSADLEKDAAHVTLTIDGVHADGGGPTPIDAITVAAAELTKRLAPPPMSDAQIRSWGAADAISARRIERIWREILLHVSPNAEEAVKALPQSDPGSAWSHMLFALVRPRRTDESRAAIKRGLELCDALPPARANAVRGTLTIIDGTDAGRIKEALRLLRLAYGEAPDDGDVAGLYAAIAIAVGMQDEGFGVLDRLVERFPTKSILALHNAIGRGVDRDLERDGRYVARMRAILPETLAWGESIHTLGESGRFSEAREALAFGRRLGLSGKSADTVPIEASQMWVELAALEPRAARDVAQRLSADPRRGVSTAGAAFVAASYLMEGRVVDAEAAWLHEIERQRTVGTPRTAAGFAFQLARARRLLGRAPPEAELVAALEKHADEIDAADVGSVLFVAEAAFARAASSPKEAKKLLAAALERADARAAREKERFMAEAGQLAAIVLVRAVRGDAAAAKLWADTAHAPFEMRRALALEAGLALEAAGKLADAEAAYRLATDPRDLEDNALGAMIARVRLAALRRAGGRADQAAALEADLDRLWQRADPGLRDAVKAMK